MLQPKKSQSPSYQSRLGLELGDAMEYTNHHHHYRNSKQPISQPMTDTIHIKHVGMKKVRIYKSFRMQQAEIFHIRRWQTQRHNSILVCFVTVSTFLHNLNISWSLDGGPSLLPRPQVTKAINNTHQKIFETVVPKTSVAESFGTYKKIKLLMIIIISALFLYCEH